MKNSKKKSRQLQLTAQNSFIKKQRNATGRLYSYSSVRLQNVKNYCVFMFLGGAL